MFRSPFFLSWSWCEELMRHMSNMSHSVNLRFLCRMTWSCLGVPPPSSLGMCEKTFHRLSFRVLNPSACCTLIIWSLDLICHLTSSAGTRGRGLSAEASTKCGSVWNQSLMGSESSGTTMSKSLSFWSKSQRCVPNLVCPAGVLSHHYTFSEPSFHFTQLWYFFYLHQRFSKLLCRSALGVSTYFSKLRH